MKNSTIINENFHFDARLSSEALALLKSCIGKKLQSISTLSSVYNIFEPNVFDCYKELKITFATETDFTYLILSSKYGINKVPVAELAYIEIDSSEETIRAFTRRYITEKIEERKFKSHINTFLSDGAVLSSIHIYGCHVNDYINNIDEDVTLDGLSERFGCEITDFPKVSCDSIEFIIFKISNNNKIVVTVKENGFLVRLKVQDDDLGNLSAYCENSNGFIKPIGLQHIIV